MRIALFNIENLATQSSIIKTLEKHHESIPLVITSDPYNKRNGGLFKQFFKNLTQRGWGFVNYLSLKMLAMPYLRGLHKLLGATTLPSISHLANQHQITHAHVKNINSPEVIELIKKHHIDLIVIFYFDQILQQPLIDSVKLGVINFHPAYLPKCRGLFPILFSYLYNDKQFGISAHWVTNNEIDAGPLIEQLAIPFKDKSSLLELDKYVCDHFPDFYEQVISRTDIKQGAPTEHQAVEGSYYSYPTKPQLKALKAQGIKLTYFRNLAGFWR